MIQIDPITTLFSSGAFTSALDASSPSAFGSVFNQAMTQSKSRAESAQLAWLQSQHMKETILFDMFSNPKTSALGFGVSDLFGTGGAFGVPAWAYDVQRLLGNDANVSDMLNIYQQTAALVQNQMKATSQLAGLGGSYDSLF